MTNKVIKTVIADDHPLILMGLEQALLKIPQVTIVAKCKNGLEAYKAIKMHAPDIAILDIQMPELSGLEVAEKVHIEKLDTYVIMLTMFHELSFFEKAKQLNVKGYLLKDSMLQELETCINTICSGTIYLSKAMQQIREEFEKKLVKLDHLSRMEKKVFHLIGEEKSSKEIAQLLFLSPKTIDNHRYNICKKLNIGGGPNALLKYVMEFTP